MGNRDMAKFGNPNAHMAPRDDKRALLSEVQQRMERYYECLGKDLDFDVEVAQKAEQLMITKLYEQCQSQKLRPRDLRQNMLAVSAFRRRTHDSLTRLAGLAQSAEQQTNIQVNFGDRAAKDEEVMEAMLFLNEAGILNAPQEEVAATLSMEAIREMQGQDLDEDNDGVEQE